MSPIRTLAICSKAAVVAGIAILCGGASCATDRSAALAEKGLPNLPQDLVTDCDDPGVRAGYPLRSELKRNRNWAKCERDKRRDQISFYQDLQAAR